MPETPGEAGDVFLLGFNFRNAAGFIVLLLTKFQLTFRLETMANPLLQPLLVVVLF